MCTYANSVNTVTAGALHKNWLSRWINVFRFQLITNKQKEMYEAAKDCLLFDWNRLTSLIGKKKTQLYDWDLWHISTLPYCFLTSWSDPKGEIPSQSSEMIQAQTLWTIKQSFSVFILFSSSWRWFCESRGSRGSLNRDKKKKGEKNWCHFPVPSHSCLK